MSTCCSARKSRDTRTGNHIFIYTCIHTSTRTHPHIHKHTYARTYIHTYIHTDIHVDKNPYTHTCTPIHTSINAYLGPAKYELWCCLGQRLLLVQTTFDSPQCIFANFAVLRNQEEDEQATLPDPEATFPDQKRHLPTTF